MLCFVIFVITDNFISHLFFPVENMYDPVDMMSH